MLDVAHKRLFARPSELHKKYGVITPKMVALKLRIEYGMFYKGEQQPSDRKKAAAQNRQTASDCDRFYYMLQNTFTIPEVYGAFYSKILQKT